MKDKIIESHAFLNEANRILIAYPSTEKRYASETDWLDSRLEQWKLNKIRIGVIGVTSSGKSTLINAILGSSLLSMAVKPSSGQLVSCSKSDEQKAVIYFFDGSVKELKGSDLTQTNIKKYSDETANIGNRENVRHIDLFTKTFALGDDVNLIDSPGLDAYKLEQHEKLTLEVLLPTIDICIYVTTCKSNSDEKMRSVLNTIAQYDRPLLIIQNMVDAVVASPDGKRTRGMEVEGHYKRVRSVVDKSRMANRSVEIVQMAARHMVLFRETGDESLYRSSRFEGFLKMVQKYVEHEKPHIEKNRIRLTIKRFEDLIENENRQINARYNGVSLVEAFKYDGLKESIESRTIMSFKNIYVYLEELWVKQQEDLDGLFEDELTEVKELVLNSEKKIYQEIHSYNRFMEKTSDSLNIPYRDFVTFSDLSSLPEPDAVMEVKPKYNWVKERTVGGFFKRIWGKITGDNCSGYNYEVTGTYSVVNEKKSMEALRRYIKNTYTNYKRSVDQWQQTIEKFNNKVFGEIDNLYESYQKRKKEFESVHEAQTVMKDLEKLVKAYKTLLEDSRESKENIECDHRDVNKNENADGHHPLSISPAMYHMARLSHAIRYALLSNAVSAAMETMGIPSLRTLLLGWDRACLSDFLNRFHGISIHDDKHLDIEKNGFVCIKDVDILNGDVGVKAYNRDPLSKRLHIFILVNTIQYGSALRQIKNSGIIEMARPDDFISFVVQDFNELIGGQAISEGLQSMLGLWDDLAIPNKGLIYINHENPVFHLAFTQLQLEPCTNISEENQFLHKLHYHFNYLTDPYSRSIIAKIINALTPQKTKEVV